MSNSTRLLRLPEVIARTGLSRSSIYLKVSERDFPKAVNLGVRAVAWLEAEIDAWVQARIEASRSPKDGGNHGYK